MTSTRMQFLATIFLLAVCHGHPQPSHLKLRARSVLDIATDDLVALRESVGGRLKPGVPIGLPCFSTYDNGHSNSSMIASAATCGDVRANWNNGSHLSNSFGGYMTPNFSTCITADQGCAMANDATARLADDSATCYQGSVPNYYIDVREVTDIQKGIEFARVHQVPLVVKNTGHDYSGRSAGAHSLALWLHNYLPPLRMYENFVADGCTEPSGPAVASAAGHSFQDVQSFTHEYGYMVVSGVSGSVGASGGWILGGGHSPFSPKLGLGVDNVLQQKAVLPNGTVITANRCQNQDLFFAMRGGGGNAFGILVETIYVAHREFSVQSAQVSFNFDDKNDTVALLTTNAEKWNQDGWGAYIDTLDSTLTMDGTVPYLSAEEAQRSLKPLTDFAIIQQNAQIEFQSYSNYWSYSKSPLGMARASTAIGNSFVVSSRLMPRSSFEEGSKRQTLIDALVAQNFLITTVGPASFQVPESDQGGGPGEASVTPAWRDSLWFIMLRAEWDSGNPADIEPDTVVANIQKNEQAIQGLRELTPDGGTYFNEAHPYEPDEGQSFWGQANYDRLLRIKSDIDPDNILTCWQCIGYDRNDPRYGCYPRL